jgi:hypothetical protein
MTRRWELENVEQAARDSATFFIPSLEERRSLRVRQMVRLHFVLRDRGPDDPRAEWIWVEVASVQEEGRYRGYLTKRPAVLGDLAPGDLVAFGREHVARVYVRQDDPRWYANAERQAMVSEGVFEDCCRWAYREGPGREDDSGWRLFAGTETEEQLADAERIRQCNVAWLCDVDPTLAELLRREDPVAFERSSKDAPWVEVGDWVPPAD